MDSKSSGMTTQMFQVLVEQTLAGVYIIQGASFRYVNPQFAKMFGYDSPDQIIDKVKITELIDPEDRELVVENVRKRTSGETDEIRYRFKGLRRDGSNLYVEVHGRASEYEGAPAVTGLLIDVTEEVVAQARLAARDRKIDALYNGSVIGVFCWNQDGMIIDANHAFMDMLGLTSEDFIGGLFWEKITPPEYFDACRAHIEEMFESGRGHPLEKEYLHRNGSRIPVLVNGTRVDGLLFSGISFVLDLRDVRRVEREREVLANIIDKAPVAMFVQDPEGHFLYTNEHFRDAASKIVGDVHGRNDFALFDPLSAEKVANDRRYVLKTGGMHHFEEELRFLGAAETEHFNSCKWPLYDESGKAYALAGVAVRMTQQRRAEAELARLHNLIESVFDNMPLIAILKDRDGRILLCNEVFTRVHNVTKEQAKGRFIWEVVPELAKEELQQHDAYVMQSRQPFVHEGRITLKNNSFPYLLNLFPIFDSKGEICATCALVQNLTEAKQAEENRLALERAEFDAFHDSLTGLPNRRLLLDRIERVMAQSKREGLKFMICFIDLDRFKEVNDSLGHAAGDELLQVLARRMATCIRESDTLARVGGDEFVVLLPGDPDKEEVQRVIDRFAEVVSDRVVLHGGEVTLSCSIGYAVYPDDGQDVEALMHKSDAMMYRMKQRGHGSTGLDALL